MIPILPQINWFSKDFHFFTWQKVPLVKRTSQPWNDFFRNDVNEIPPAIVIVIIRIVVVSTLFQQVKGRKLNQKFNSNQVIQAVTFWSPNVGLVTWNQPLKGSRFHSPSQKGHKELPGMRSLLACRNSKFLTIPASKFHSQIKNIDDFFGGKNGGKILFPLRERREGELVVEPTHLKNMLVKLASSSPKFGVKIKNVWVATT